MTNTDTRPRPPITTVREFKTRAVRAFRTANPDAVTAGVTIEWRGPVRRIARWADGSSGFAGEFVAACPGYRTRLVRATYATGDGLMVR